MKDSVDDAPVVDKEISNLNDPHSPRERFRSGRTYEQDGVQPRWLAIFDERGRVQVAICHNMDLGDAWEWADDPRYPERFASLAYRIGINYIVYPMTH